MKKSTKIFVSIGVIVAVLAVVILILTLSTKEKPIDIESYNKETNTPSESITYNPNEEDVPSVDAEIKEKDKTDDNNIFKFGVKQDSKFEMEDKSSDVSTDSKNEKEQENETTEE